MKRITVNLASGSSDVLVGTGQLRSLAELLSEEGLTSTASVVSNTTVGPLYGDRLAQDLRLESCLQLDDGEVHKRWPAVEAICHHWLERGLHRRHTVLAVGGGVVTDVVGFAAAVYQRGIQWIAVPTTLLAMVDAAVGGKTGVNLEAGKNLVGAFWPPRLVVADVTTLTSLPEREITAGLFEVVKTAWIGDRALLGLISSNRYGEIVARSAAVKARVVMADEREAGGRKALNLGHTLGHAFEAATGYQRFLHGEAVGWGLLAATGLAHQKGLISDQGRAELDGAVRSLGPLPPIDDLDPDLLLGYLKHDKKLDQHGVAWVLPTDDGVLLDQRLENDDIRAVLRTLMSGDLQ